MNNGKWINLIYLQHFFVNIYMAKNKLNNSDINVQDNDPISVPKD